MPEIYVFSDWVILPAERQEKYRKILRAGVYRLSVGIENADDLIEDLDQALKSIN